MCLTKVSHVEKVSIYPLKHRRLSLISHIPNLPFTLSHFHLPAIIYLMYVIEYQHRGLPHAHLVYRVHYELPPHSAPLSAAELLARQEIIRKRIDGYEETIGADTVYHLPEIMAYRPVKSDKPAADRSPDEEADCILYDMVTKHNIHGHSVPSCKKTKESRCKRGYEDFTISTQTTWSPKNKPIYKRPTESDLMVVAYKASMMLDWQGHLNVESATSERSVAYLYNYLFKGILKILAEARRVLALSGNGDAGTVNH